MDKADVKHWQVLIVDNEPDNVSVAQMMLTFNGAVVRSARHGAEGLEVLREFTPTFILLDLSMPVMDGWEMLEKVRENPATAHIPTIALTAHAAGLDQEQALTEGFDGVIVKPFRIDTLIMEIQRCLVQSASIRVSTPANL
jgi:CheY-like chemotaxis protein